MSIANPFDKKDKKVEGESKNKDKTKSEILLGFGGLESNIPVDHKYWKMK